MKQEKKKGAEIFLARSRRRIRRDSLSQLLSRVSQSREGGKAHTEGCHSKTTCNDRTLKTFLVYVIASFSPTKLHSSSDKDAAAMYFLNISFQIRFQDPVVLLVQLQEAGCSTSCTKGPLFTPGRSRQDYWPGACAACARRVWCPPTW